MFYGELQARAIIDGAGKSLLAVSYKQARDLWDKDRPNAFAVLPGGAWCASSMVGLVRVVDVP